jgi:hypothetical protein
VSNQLGRVYVIGMGEVGRRLFDALEAVGVDLIAVTREQGWGRAESDPDGLRLVCVREEVLEPVIERLRNVPDDQIVAVQNGWIRSFFNHLHDPTRGLIWFTSKGDFFEVLRPSPFHGPWAEALATALVAGGIPATAVHEPEFGRLDADKMGFNCVVGLPLAVHGLSLAEYLDRHRDEAHELFTESVTACATALGTTPDPDWWDGFLRSVEPLGWVSTGIAKALEFRNGAVVRLASENGIPVPVTERLLEDHERQHGLR